MDNESVNKEENVEVAEEVADENKVKAKKKRKKQKKTLSYYFTGGIIMSLIGKLTDTIYRWLAEGLFGTVFSAYSAERRMIGSGALEKYLAFGDKTKRYTKRTRGVFAEAFERSFFVGFFNKINRIFLEMPLRNYGNYFFTFGLYTVFSYFVKHFIDGIGIAKTSELISGLAFLFIAVPLLSSKRSLANALGSSASARALLCDAFGFRDERFELPLKQTKLRANLSIVLGMLSGLFSFVSDALIIPTVAFIMILISLVIISPEIGIVISLFLIPFFTFFTYPSFTLGLLLGLSAIGFLIKLVRGKRMVKIELIDGAVILFALMIFYSGAISMGGSNSFYDAVLACVLILIYFLIVNMMRTDKWVGRCVMALVSSATIVSVVGIVEYFFGDLTARWLDVEYFPDIKGRVVSLFDNSNVLAFYIVMIFPFAIDTLFRCRNKREKLLNLLSLAAMVLCLVFTWSRGAWIGLLVVTLFYAVIKTRKTVKLLFWLCFLVPLLPMLLPQNVINRFLSIGDMSDSSTYYRFHTWLGSFDLLEDHLFGGIGYGSSAFDKVYPQYAHAGIEAAEHSHNLFLQITIMMGIVGLIAFLIVLVLFAQKNMEYYRDTKYDSSYKSVAMAAFSSVVAAACMGMFDHIWYNNRIFFLFWAVMGISCAVIRNGNSVTDRTEIEEVCDKRSAFIDIM